MAVQRFCVRPFPAGTRFAWVSRMGDPRLTDATRAEQEAGIRDWLSTHEPHPSLVIDLWADGFEHLIVAKSA